MMPEKSFYVVFKTAAGWVGILGSPAGLRRVTLPQPSAEKALAQLGVNDEAVLAPEPYYNLIQRFQAYFAGKSADFPDKLDLSEATPFQRAVWAATRRIPFGQTRSYAWAARQTGKPGAARAVGQALSKNPLPVIIPCHRVLRRDGSLGGFRGGLAMKKFLLALEKRDGGRQAIRAD
jgi:methylated-DNA-[protein]-cysteine S-methyltransferase